MTANSKRGRLAALMAPIAFLAAVVMARATPPRLPPEQKYSNPLKLSVSRFLDVASSAGEAGKTGHAFPAMEMLLGVPSDTVKLTAYEENRFFVYGEVNLSDPATGSRWTRRVFFFKPSIFIVDDTRLTRDSEKPVAWQIYTGGFPRGRGAEASIEIDDGNIVVESLLPDKVIRRALRCTGPECQRVPEPHVLEILPSKDATRARFLHVLKFPIKGNPRPRAQSELMKSNGVMLLTVDAGNRILRWSLPSEGNGSGEVSIQAAENKNLVSTRPLPSGVMPHTPEGIRLLDIWDGDYRDGRHPKWDTGQPSADLKNAVEQGIIKPGRAVEFGCGTGTDAIYMAQHGFDVTAIDISPSAVAQALEKARRAGVSVRFLLADALNPPEIGKFDFIYDRACYHEVRGQNLEAYLQTLRIASRPGTRMLLLAGNASGPDLGFGPPTVTEEELRFDFLPLFDIEKLRVSHFEVNQPAAGLPLAWSVLMQRRPD